MTEGVSTLYQEILMDHQRDPRNFRVLENPDREAEGFNPVCGDRVHLQLSLDASGKIPHICFQGDGCSICMASASMMTEEIQGKTREEALGLVENFRSFMQGQEGVSVEGDLLALEGVKRFPVRIKCALLPWMALKEALEGRK